MTFLVLVFLCELCASARDLSCVLFCTVFSFQHGLRRARRVSLNAPAATNGCAGRSSIPLTSVRRVPCPRLCVGMSGSAGILSNSSSVAVVKCCRIRTSRQRAPPPRPILSATHASRLKTCPRKAVGMAPGVGPSGNSDRKQPLGARARRRRASCQLAIRIASAVRQAGSLPYDFAWTRGRRG